MIHIFGAMLLCAITAPQIACDGTGHFLGQGRGAGESVSDDQDDDGNQGDDDEDRYTDEHGGHDCNGDDDDDCEVECTAEALCEAEGGTRCAGDVLQQCTMDAFGCLLWTDEVDCANTQQWCDDGGDIATCAAECDLTQECYAEGATQCAGRALESCTTASDGYRAWSKVATCDERCDASEGDAVCVAAAPLASFLEEGDHLWASNLEKRDQFGFSIALSGNTLAVGANKEDGSDGGINGDEADNGANDSGGVYLFQKSDQGWQQDAYVKASNPGGYPYSVHKMADGFGHSLALDGDTLVVGALGEDSSATGVDGNQDDETSADSGAVYVFRRSAGTWQQEAYIKASNNDPRDGFGVSVAISGDTLVVGAYGEAGGAAGIQGDEADNSMPGSGAVYVFRRCGSTWSQEAYVKASNPDAEDRFGNSVAISGNTLVVGAYGEASSASEVQGNQSDNTQTRSGAVYVFQRERGSWSQEAYIKASQSSADSVFGANIAIAGDSLAASSHDEPDSGGVVYMFSRDENGWRQEVRLEATNAEARDRFGVSVALSDGLLAVGAMHNRTSELSGNLVDKGAAYLFAREDGQWRQAQMIEAASPELCFGCSIAVSGNDLIVGAPTDSPSSEPATLTGAVYGFR